MSGRDEFDDPRERSSDSEPVDALATPPRPSAMGVNGRQLDAIELESAAELNRLVKRLGLAGAGLDPFRLYRLYCRYRDIRIRRRRPADPDS